MIDIDEDDILRSVAAGSSIDYSVWPVLLPRIVSRIEKIAHDEFPIPVLPPPSATTIPSSIPQPTATTTTQPDPETTENFLSPLPSSPIQQPDSGSSSQDTNKENTPIAPRTNAPPTSFPASAVPPPPGTLPPQIASMLHEVTSTLTSTFPEHPPHTIQRLSELVLAPKHHYRSLPAYLHALDRVVHVTSSLNIYPLPPAVPDMTTASVLSNGVPDALAAQSPWATPGSDEALGGALLTPIPWLQPNHQGMTGSPQPQPQSSTMTPEPIGTSSGHGNGSAGGMSNDLEGEVHTESTETIDGPNGVGSIETVSVSVNGIPSMGARGIGVTQGELLRQEQRAGVVPVSQLVPSHHVHGGNAHAQAHMRASASASASSSPSPDSNKAASSPSTLHEEKTPTPTPDTEEPHVPVASVPAADEEKPHARGPEEIGPEDMGPQSASSTSTISNAGGLEMQGIDVEAAVGRKASEGTAREPDAEADDADKMDVEGPGPERASTPKREAEDELEGATKKLKEDRAASSSSSTTAMDTDGEEGKGAEEKQKAET
ncbi:hypothetical protein F4779DRAFT_624515 [Xylariaceae sp. FL0662B]|nr:hypothetical protein F4779DRAFT_624515 [Xylariaceae sp. FL0662B]